MIQVSFLLLNSLNLLLNSNDLIQIISILLKNLYFSYILHLYESLGYYHPMILNLILLNLPIVPLFLQDLHPIHLFYLLLLLSAIKHHELCLSLLMFIIIFHLSQIQPKLLYLCFKHLYISCL